MCSWENKHALKGSKNTLKHLLYSGNKTLTNFTLFLVVHTQQITLFYYCYFFHSIIIIFNWLL